MPHLILEYSSNIIDKPDFAKLFEKLQASLVENLPTKMTSCVSRAIKQENFYIGEGDKENAFVHLQCKALKGREQKVLQNATQALSLIVNDYFQSLNPNLKIRCSVEFVELSDFYV